MKKTSLVLSLLLILGPLARTDVHINNCPTESQLIRQFNAVSSRLAGPTNGVTCQIEEHHDDDDQDGDHRDDNHHNYSNNSFSCMSAFNLCESLILSLNLTTEECLEHGHIEGNTSSTVVDPSKAYGYGFLMVLFESLISLVGVLLVPLINSNSKVGRQTYEYVYALMVAVGISALISDAVLHLIPHSFFFHADHGGSDGGHGHGDDEEDLHTEALWKGSVLLLGIYIFYIVEVILHVIGDLLRKKSSSSVSHHEHRSLAGDSHYSSNVPEIKTETTTKLDNDDKGVSSKSETIELESGDNKVAANVEPNGGLAKIMHGTRFKFSLYKIKPVAWLIIIGDAAHNFADGLALGAAIAQSLALGLSTMFALIFHEVPLELGGFIILVKSGMHWAFALVFNFLSSLIAFIGFFIGVAVSTHIAVANESILAITAGLFFYIALTDLLPELIHIHRGGEHIKLTKTGCHWALRFLLINLGFFISFALILILGLYEDSLNELIK